MSEQDAATEHGNYPFLKGNFLGKSKGASIISPGENGYFVIGNFRDVHDEVLNKSFNVLSGLTNEAFHTLFEVFAEENGLKVAFKNEGWIVLYGSPDAYEKLQAGNGSSFSYAHIDEQQYQLFKDAEENWLLEKELGLLEVDEAEAGSEKPKVAPRI